MKACLRFLFIAFFNVILVATIVSGQQLADPNFDAKVARPAYLKSHPKILFDEAHNNFHTSTGRYKPFADLITNDGYSVSPNTKKFQRKTLDGYDILIIANALGAPTQNLPEANQPAFTEEECDAVRDWVRAGGSLLLIADHAPFGAAAENLARRFGIDMAKGHTSDPANYDRATGNMSFLVFSRENKLIPDHAITRGRQESEKINRIITFTGQSLKGPAGSSALLPVADTAIDLTRLAAGQGGDSRPIERLPDGRPLPPGARVLVQGGGRSTAPASGRAQGVAFDFGRGRVVALGEAAMLSAQVVRGAAAQMLGREELQMGMNVKGIDNRQLALNIVHWLSRLLN